MKKIKIDILMISLVALSLGIAASGFSENDKPIAQAAQIQAKGKTAKKELTKDELLAQLKDELSKNREVFKVLPGLNVEKDKEGNISYTFKGVRLDDMAKGDLDELSAKVRQILVRVRVERIQRQLNTIKQAQHLQNVTPSKPPSVPAAPPLPPKTSVPPPVPSPYSRK